MYKNVVKIYLPLNKEVSTNSLNIKDSLFETMSDDIVEFHKTVWAYFITVVSQEDIITKLEEITQNFVGECGYQALSIMNRGLKTLVKVVEGNSKNMAKASFTITKESNMEEVKYLFDSMNIHKGLKPEVYGNTLQYVAKNIPKYEDYIKNQEIWEGDVTISDSELWKANICFIYNLHSADFYINSPKLFTNANRIYFDMAHIMAEHPKGLRYVSVCGFPNID